MGSEQQSGAAANAAALSLTGVGLWQVDRLTGRISLDARSAELLGLPGSPTELTSAQLRAHLHRADGARLRPAARLAEVQHRPVDLRVRAVGSAGDLIRVLRLRIALADPDDPKHHLLGTATEENWADAVDYFAHPDDGDQSERAQRQVEAMNRTPGPGSATPGPGSAAARNESAPSDDTQRTRAARLLDAGRALAEADGADEVLRVIGNLSVPGFEIDGQIVFEVRNGLLALVDHYGFPSADAGPFQVTLDSDAPAAEAVRSGHPVYLPDQEDYRRRYPVIWPMVSTTGRQSWAYFPLYTAGRITGAWMVTFRTPMRFTPDERAMLAELSRMLSHALERATTNEAERALSLGLQRSMQPRSQGAPGLAAAARYVPTGGGLLVGGDWCDVLDLPNGRLAVVIGDVEGHDVHAASIMSQLRTAVLAYAVEGHHPDAVLARASRFLAGLDQERYATCIYLVADAARGTLDIARAGHPHPVVRMPDGTCLLRHIDGGLPLGLGEFGEEDYPVNRLELQLGEILMLCTDGLVENGGHDYYSGWIRCRDALSPGPVDDLEEIADRLIAAVHGPASHNAPGHLHDRREDDIALVLLRRDPVGAKKRGFASRRTVLTIDQDEQDRIAGARRELRGILHDWAVEDHVDAAVLLASELLANVLVHTDVEAALDAYLTGPPGERTLHVEVTDRSDELPHRRTPGEMASSGRGLVLLEMLSDRWGVQPRGEGKCIWFQLDEGRSQGPDSSAGQPN